jgi:hypothetical protein
MEHMNILLPDPKAVETYVVVAMSTGHLTKEDEAALTLASDDPEENMLMKRDTGFLLKLMGPATEYDMRHGHSETFLRIIRWANTAGFRMIEFDRDAPVMSCFQCFEW